MKGICYRLPELSDCELYCCAESCPGMCIVKEKIDDDAILMQGFVPVALNDEEYMERAIRRYGEFSKEQLEEKALYDADGKNDCLGRIIVNGKVRRYDNGVDLHEIYARAEKEITKDDLRYADWCFQNNWWKGDYEIWLYIGGNDDDDYHFWVEKELGLLKECPMQPHLFCAIDDECDYCRVPTWESSYHDYTPEELEIPWDEP